MESQEPSPVVPARPGYGPRPSTGRQRSALSKARSAVLEILRAQPGPTGLTTLVDLSGLHSNTVREHLDGLVRAGLAHRSSAAPAGRGRPARLYEATAEDVVATPEYAGLAAALAATLHRTSPAPTRDAVVAGRDWGRRLARERGAAPEHTAVAARRQVVALLDELGFAPRPDARAERVRLTRCPLLETARQYPDVVCGVHLGLAQGALTEFGADTDGTELHPFAEPGACTLRLARRRVG